MRLRTLILPLLMIVQFAIGVLPAPAAGTPVPLADKIHVVRPGETLVTIAASHGLTLAVLIQANNITNANRIYPGQRIVIPDVSPNSRYSSGSTHVVQAGETLAAIAWRHGTTAAELSRANGLSNPSLIYPGQRLVVPGGGSSSGSISGGSGGAPASGGPAGEKWIAVSLKTQTLVAYEGVRPVFRAVVSTGLPKTPTPKGRFRVYFKLRKQDMTGGSRAAGDYYYLPNVPYVQYFYQAYALHGTYWHNNFGRPMSRGCVNLKIKDAEWLFKWTSPTVPANRGVVKSSAVEPGTLVSFIERMTIG